MTQLLILKKSPMRFLNRKSLNYVFTKVSHRYEESSLGNFWYTGLFTIRVLIFYFMMRGIGGANIPSFLFYVASGALFYELFKDFCSQCLEVNKRRKNIDFKWDIRKYYLLYQGVVLCFYLPILLIAAFICKVNFFKFIFFFGLGLGLFTFWLYHLSAIFSFIAEKNAEIKMLIKIGMSYLLFLTPVFWGVNHAPDRVKLLLSTLNPLAYVLDIPRYAILPFEPERFVITLAMISATYLIARLLNWQDQGMTAPEGMSKQKSSSS